MDEEEAFGRGFSVGKYIWILCYLIANVCVVQQTFGVEVDFAGQSLIVCPKSSKTEL